MYVDFTVSPPRVVMDTHQRTELNKLLGDCLHGCKGHASFVGALHDIVTVVSQMNAAVVGRIDNALAFPVHPRVIGESAKRWVNVAAQPGCTNVNAPICWREEGMEVDGREGGRREEVVGGRFCGCNLVQYTRHLLKLVPRSPRRCRSMTFTTGVRALEEGLLAAGIVRY